jgi:hypothetical protein
VIDAESEVSLTYPEPRLLRRGIELFEKPGGAAMPSACDGWSSPEVERIVRQRDRHTRGRARIAAIAVQTIRAFPGFEDGRRIVQPPRGHRRTLQCLRRFLLRKSGVECAACLGPTTGGQGGLTRADFLARRLHERSSIANVSRPTRPGL